MTGPRKPYQKSDKNPEEEGKQIDPTNAVSKPVQPYSGGTLPHKQIDPTTPGKFVLSSSGVSLPHDKQIDPTNLRGSIVQFSSSGTLPEEEPKFGQKEISNLLKKKDYKSKKLNPQEGLDPLSEIDLNSLKKRNL